MSRPPSPHTIALLFHPPGVSPAWEPRLRKSGFRTVTILDAETLWASARDRRTFAAILLCLSDATDEAAAALPLLAARRERPVLVLLARGTAFDRAALLDAGAADVLGPDIRPVELAARLRARLRATGFLAPQSALSEPLFTAGCRIDPATRTVRRPDGSLLNLTAAEFDLLAALASVPGRVWRRDALLQAIGRAPWDVGGRSIDVLIGRLRRKLGDEAETPQRIETVRGCGYRLASESARPAAVARRASAAAD
jgi:two-component system OmpR family response regulator